MSIISRHHGIYSSRRVDPYSLLSFSVNPAVTREVTFEGDLASQRWLEYQIDTDCTCIVNHPIPYVAVFLTGGGGGGGCSNVSNGSGGRGGAGAYSEQFGFGFSVCEFAIHIGGGGSGAAATQAGKAGSVGGDTQIQVPFMSFVNAYGGAGGSTAAGGTGTNRGVYPFDDDINFTTQMCTAGPGGNTYTGGISNPAKQTTPGRGGTGAHLQYKDTDPTNKNGGSGGTGIVIFRIPIKP